MPHGPVTPQHGYNSSMYKTDTCLACRIREQSNWYSTKRVVRRTRSGKVELSRLGSVSSNRQFYFPSSVSVCGSDWTDVTSHDFD